MNRETMLDLARCYKRAALKTLIRKTSPDRWLPFHVVSHRSRRGRTYVQLAVRP